MNTDKKVKISCNDVSKTFYVPGQKQLLHVLNKVSLKVYENEFMVILGPGQSGKTVLNTVAGLLEQAQYALMICPFLGRAQTGAWCFSVTRSFRGKQ